MRKISRLMLFSICAIMILAPGCLEENGGPDANEEEEEISPIDDLNFKFVSIPSGTFMMGSHVMVNLRLEQPQHQVTISRGFEMLAYEVTQAQFEAVMGHNPSANVGENHPVELARYEWVLEFIEKLNEMDPHHVYGLPTEAQWEYACRAGSTEHFCFGNDTARLADYAWYKDNADMRTHPVGEKLPNAWGLYDMHGNVFEFCSDYYYYYPDDPQTDPSGPPNGTHRVIRGGSYRDIDMDVRSAARQGIYLEIHPFMGFRIIRVEA
ncbi:MAG: formylglycine-generating enzyme family protein [Candidatus Thermoplasmatota archaeon]|nr:formylglycine-generating enzyme family protein [Candidatus Thermoplasmatota archaeon]